MHAHTHTHMHTQNEYTGGGTCFEAVRPADQPELSFEPAALNAEAGGVVAFGGKLRHGGQRITSGKRYIIPLFVYLDDNASGEKPGYSTSALKAG